jgi:pilus assembly protein CpaF
LRFISNKTLLSIIERIITAINRRIDESSPYVDARLPDGSRVNAIIPPVALSGPCLTIRKFTKNSVSAADLISLGAVTEEVCKYLENAVLKKANILIGGGTGSGKTTLLNVLSAFIPEDSRIITIEDSAELKLQKPHVISLEGRPPNLEGKGEITIRDLVRNSLRMRPDRLIIGECRGRETLDMLQAMNTGHDGSMTTAHANSPRDLLSRIETMVLFSGLDLPVKAIREQIASALDLIVFLARMGCGKRKVTGITEITGISDLTIMTQDIFAYDKQKGTLVKTCIRSKLGDY